MLEMRERGRYAAALGRGTILSRGENLLAAFSGRCGQPQNRVCARRQQLRFSLFRCPSVVVFFLFSLSFSIFWLAASRGLSVFFSVLLSLSLFLYPFPSLFSPASLSLRSFVFVSISVALLASASLLLLP